MTNMNASDDKATGKLLRDFTEVSRELIDAWEENEIGQVDGELIEKLARLVEQVRVNEKELDRG